MHVRSTAVAFATLAAAMPAAAQSTVTIGGIADVAARYVDNDGVGGGKSLVSGSNNTSRVFIRGVEDLGSGLSASFHLEHGLQLDTGAPVQATQFWDRRSTVSVASTAFGEIRAGRDYVPTYVGWTRYDPFSYVGVAGSNNLVSASPQGPIRSAFGTNPNTTVRSSNAAQWLMPPTWGGVEGGIMLAPGEGGTAANGQHEVVGLRVGYAGGSLNLSSAYVRSQNDLTAAAGGAIKDAMIGGAYDFGVARLSVALRRFDQANAKQTNVLVGAWVPVGVGEIKLSYNRADFSGSVGATSIEDNGARQLGVGYVHNLSKRTALYGTVSRLDNRGALALAVPGGPAGLTPGGTSNGVEVGMRHNF